MVVSLLRVLNSGLQDTRLQAPSTTPTIHTFYSVYKRAGRFTTEWYRVDYDTTPGFGLTTKVTLPRRGHLITRLYLVTTMPDIATPQAQARSTIEGRAAAGEAVSYAGPYIGWTNSLGHALVNQVQIEIGGTPIDRFDGRLLEILDEFKTPFDKLSVTNRLLKRTEHGFNATTYGFSTPTPTEVITPLPFWFSQGDTAAALPIDAISQDAVTVTVQFNTLDKLYVSSDQSNGAITVLSTTTNTPLLPVVTAPSGGQCAPPLASQPLFYYSTTQAGVSSLFQIPGLAFPTVLTMGQAYVLAEYVYLDSPEANRLRLGDLTIPITQHYLLTPFDTLNNQQVRMPLRIPNPTRDLFFYAHRQDADRYNAPFLATRDLSPPNSSTLWWPDARTVDSIPTVPAFITYPSEPIQSLALLYEGKLLRYATDSPALFRSLLPSLEQRKAPWINRYFYTLPFGTQHGFYGPTQPMGEANLDKLQQIELQLSFTPNRGDISGTSVPRYTIYPYAETYNILKVYGGRAGTLFGY